MNSLKHSPVMTSELKIMIVDDHQTFSQSLANLINSRDGYSVLNISGSGNEAIKYLESDECKEYPDVILMDLLMDENPIEDPDGLRTSRYILKNIYKKEVNEIKIILISQSLSGLYIKAAHDLCVHGYLAKEDSVDVIFNAIESVNKGEMYYRGKINTEMSKYKFSVELGNDDEEIIPPSPTELEILQDTAEGRTAKEIASKRNAGVDGIEAHKRQLMRKLGARNTPEMISIAYKKGYLKLY